MGPEVKVILLEAPKDHPFVQIELMMPILPLVRVPNVYKLAKMAKITSAAIVEISGWGYFLL